jgi:O-antigen/teichoic acid export membrane protein
MYIGLIMPVLSRHAFSNRQKFIASFRKSFDILSIFALPVMAYLYLRAADIINIVGGSGYGQSIQVLKILSLAIMLIFFGNLAGNALVALNLQKKGMWVYLAGAIFNIAVNLIFIPKFSYMATAWSTVLTELIITVLLFRLIKKETALAVDLKVAGKVILATIITVIGLSFLNLGFIVFSVLSLLYFVILYLLGGFTIDDFKSIISRRADQAYNSEVIKEP